MTPADTIKMCDGLDALRAKATPGKWHRGFFNGHGYNLCSSDSGRVLVSIDTSDEFYGLHAEYLVALHNAAPDIIKAARREAKLLKTVQIAHDFLEDNGPHERPMPTSAFIVLRAALKDAGQ